VAEFVCKIKDCLEPRKHLSKGFCRYHYNQYSKGWWTPEGTKTASYAGNDQVRYNPNANCTLSGCDKVIIKKGFCDKHYKWFKKKYIDASGKQLVEKVPQKNIYKKDVLCSMKNCKTKARRMYLCPSHYKMVYLTKTLLLDGSPNPDAKHKLWQRHFPKAKCKICGEKTKLIKGFCKPHYTDVYLGRINEQGGLLRPKKFGPKYCKTCFALLQKHEKKNGLFCAEHRKAFNRGELDKNGCVIPKAPPKPKMSCKICGKTGRFIANGYCKNHLLLLASGRIDAAGVKIAKPKLTKPKCKICGKDRPPQNPLNMCSYHFVRYQGGYIDDAGKIIVKPEIRCKICNVRSQYIANGYCREHLSLIASGRIDTMGAKLPRPKCKKCGKGCSKKFDAQLCGRHYKKYKEGRLDAEGRTVSRKTCKACGVGKRHVSIVGDYCAKHQHGRFVNCAYCQRRCRLRPDGIELCWQHYRCYKSGSVKANGQKVACKVCKIIPDRFYHGYCSEHFYEKFYIENAKEKEKVDKKLSKEQEKIARKEAKLRDKEVAKLTDQQNRKMERELQMEAREIARYAARQELLKVKEENKKQWIQECVIIKQDYFSIHHSKKFCSLCPALAMENSTVCVKHYHYSRNSILVPVVENPICDFADCENQPLAKGICKHHSIMIAIYKQSK